VLFTLVVTAVALFLAAVTRRPLTELLEFHFRALPALWSGITLHLLLSLPQLEPLFAARPWPGFLPLGGASYILSLSLLVVFAWLNRRVLGVSVIGVGLLMNAAVIAGNGGQMPVDPVQLAAKGALEEEMAIQARGLWSSHAIMVEESRLAFLGDWILVRGPMGYEPILSPGDLVISAGIFVFFMVIPEHRRRPIFFSSRNRMR
jgi:hypothetical protein